jgi:hypothetical protein
MKCTSLRHRSLRFVAATLVSLCIATIIAPVVLFAQRIDTIRTNPDAVLLRRIWTQGGNGAGNVVAAMPDLNGDGRAEFATAERGGVWRIFSLDSLQLTRVLWEIRSESHLPLIHGRLQGDQASLIVRVRERDTALLATLYDLDIFLVDSGIVALTPSFHWHSRTNGARLIAPRFHTADLDLDGADELIVAVPNVVRNGATERNGEVWIYRGGPDFQTDTPTVVIRDDEIHGNEYKLHIGRLDGDEYPDLIAATFNGGRIRWGGSDLSAFARPVDRKFTMASTWIHLLDADGDGRSDFLSDGPPMQVMLHLSSSEKNPRTRAFDTRDADRTFVGRGNTTFPAGPVNDSADRYDMFGINSALGDGDWLFFSGGAGGPDAKYEAHYRAASDGLSGEPIGYRVPAGDVDGNGWRDLLCGRPSYPGGGISIVLGGGPHIPRDSMPASAIRDLPVGRNGDAITVWPNPARDIVHVAWRGDLDTTPARFEVHDALGRLVAAGATEGELGEVEWVCADRRPGAYLLSIFDRDGGRIAVVPIVKH